MTATLSELAERFGCRYRGEPDRVVRRVATLAGADGDCITFLANPKFRGQLAGTRAAVVILEPELAPECPTDCLMHENPYATYARIADYLHPQPSSKPGIHASAVIAPDARIAPTASIGPHVVIGAASDIGERVEIGAGTVIGRAVLIGADCRLAARVAIDDDVRIGRRCTIHSGAVIGADGFGFAPDGRAWVKVPQLGGVVLGDDVEIGANTTIDRGTIDDTVIEDGVKLDNLVQIAHNVRVGEHTVMAAMSGAAGSTTIGKRCMIGGGVVLINHISICDDVTFLFRSVVTKSIGEPGVYSGALPADEVSRWRRNAARFKQLDRLAERLRRLEKK